LIAKDSRDDLALLKISKEPVEKVTFGAKQARAGEAVIAYGFPLSGLLATSGNVTIGNVTAVAGLFNNPHQLQISAPVQPGNSGGPLLDASGHLVGLVVSKLDAMKVAKIVDDIPQNVNFAIKSSVIMNFLDAQNVPYAIETSGAPISTPEVTAAAQLFSVHIRCEEKDLGDR
jgi:S1-C subfamily serine protease